MLSSLSEKALQEHVSNGHQDLASMPAVHRLDCIYTSSLVSRQYPLQVCRARQPICLCLSELNLNYVHGYPKTKQQNF